MNVLKELGFKSFYTVINKNTNEDNKETSSIKTEISLGDPSIILEDKSINEIYKDNIKPILREENYDKRYKEYINKLEDLNKNCKDYYGENSTNTYINLKEYKNASLNFYKFKDSQITKILYLYGPKNCSKTTFLFCMINKFKRNEIGTLYFNFNYLRDKGFMDIKKTIYNEILYFCRDKEEMKNIEDFKVFKGINKYENIMQLN